MLNENRDNTPSKRDKKDEQCEVGSRTVDVSIQCDEGKGIIVTQKAL